MEIQACLTVLGIQSICSQQGSETTWANHNTKFFFSCLLSELIYRFTNSMLRKITYHHFLIAAKLRIFCDSLSFSNTSLAFRVRLREPYMNYLRWLRRLAWCPSSLEPLSSGESKLLPFRGELLSVQYRCFKRLHTELTKTSYCFDNSSSSCMQGVHWNVLKICIVSDCWICVNRRRHFNLSKYAAVHTTLKSSLKRWKFNLKNNLKKAYYINWIAIKESVKFYQAASVREFTSTEKRKEITFLLK